MTLRIPEASYERLRRLAIETRLSQQALADQAVNLLLAERSSG
jgi:hypothetical protein